MESGKLLHHVNFPCSISLRVVAEGCFKIFHTFPKFSNLLFILKQMFEVITPVLTVHCIKFLDFFIFIFTEAIVR